MPNYNKVFWFRTLLKANDPRKYIYWNCGNLIPFYSTLDLRQTKPNVKQATLNVLYS